MGRFADFWLGKEKLVDVDMKPAVATITMDDGAVHTISRDGKEFGEWTMTGEECLHSYLHGKRTILQDDKLQYLPTCHIAKISVEVKTNVVKLRYR